MNIIEAVKSDFRRYITFVVISLTAVIVLLAAFSYFTLGNERGRLAQEYALRLIDHAKLRSKLEDYQGLAIATNELFKQNKLVIVELKQIEGDLIVRYENQYQTTPREKTLQRFTYQLDSVDSENGSATAGTDDIF